MKSVMTHQFSQVPQANIPRSQFDRSCGSKMTFSTNKLIPILVDEALPGDTFNVKSAGFVRLSTPIFPIMDNMFMETFYFAVPLRLLWNNFQKMMGEQDNPNDTTDYLTPQIQSDPAGYANESIYDYMGLPTQVAASFNHNALPLRAYNLIYNEWFRDDVLEPDQTISKGDGTDSSTNTELLNANWRKDRFTSARDSPQQGDAVTIPIDLDFSDANATTTVTGGDIASSGPFSLDNRNLNFVNGLANPVAYSGDQTGAESVSYSGGLSRDDYDATTTLSGDAAVGITVEQLRRSLALQRFGERLIRHGNRYTEYLRSMGIRSSDARLDRPEYLGGGKQTVQFDEVLQTTPEPDETLSGVGRYAGHGIGAMRSNRYVRHFNEHGILMSLMIVRPTTMYMSGAARMWFRDSFDQYYQPELAHLGMQEVFVGEVDMEHATDHRTVFGYQDAYDEYRHQPSYVSGQMAGPTIKNFHFGREFTAEPSLNKSFIECVVPTDRFQIADSPQFFGMIRHNLRARRVLKRAGTPLTM